MSAEREKLESTIEADAQNVAAYQVYGDLLQSEGDPRGQLIALRHAAMGTSAAAKSANRKALAFEKKHAALLLGELAPILKRGLKLEWRFGFIHHAYVDQPTDLSTEEALRRLLTHPSARFLRELMIGRVDRGANDYRPIVKLLSNASAPALRTLWLGVGDGDGHEQTMIGSIEAFTRSMPRLQALLISGNGLELGRFAMPLLNALSIQTWALSNTAMQSLVQAKVPKLESLRIDFGPRVEPYDAQLIADFLAAPWWSGLKKLNIQRIKKPDDFAAALAASPGTKALEHLAFGLASMSDVGALALAEGSFPSLKNVSVPYNRLTKVGRDALKKRWPTSQLLPQY